MKFTYQLTAQEIEEAWIASQWRNVLFQRWNQLILTALVIGFLVFYTKDPEKFYLILCAALIVILLFYNTYFILRRWPGRTTGWA